MIKILKVYIGKHLVFANLITSFLMISLVFLIGFLTELKNIGTGDYGFAQAMFYVLMHLPNDIYQFYPVILLLSTIIGLSFLNSHQELIIMRTSGFSFTRILIWIMTVSLCILFLVTILAESFAPRLSYDAEVYKENQQNAGTAVVTSSGIWLHIKNNFIHVQKVIGHHILNGVTVYQFDDARNLKTAKYAKTMIFTNHVWKMKDVVSTDFMENSTISKREPEYDLHLKINMNLFKAGLVNPHELSLWNLSSFIHYLEANGLQANEYKFEFWQRLFQPLASLIMIFLAVPFLLQLNTRAYMGKRIMVGILVGFLFIISNALLAQLSIVYQLPIVLAAASPLMLFSILGFMSIKFFIRH